MVYESQSELPELVFQTYLEAVPHAKSNRNALGRGGLAELECP